MENCYTCDDKPTIPIKHVVHQWRRRFGGANDTTNRKQSSSSRASRLISKLLHLSPLPPDTSTDVIPTVSKRENNLVQSVAVPLVEKMAQDTSFLATVFSNPELSTALGTQNLTPLEMKDGTVIVINPETETRSQKEIVKDYNKATATTSTKTSMFGRLWSSVKRGLRFVGSMLKQALHYIKYGIVTIFTFLYNNVNLISWTIRTLLMVKRATCLHISQAFKVTIFRPSGVTWFYKMQQWWNNWIVPVSYAAWPGVKGLFFTIMPKIFDGLSSVSATLDRVKQIDTKEKEPENETAKEIADAILPNSIPAANPASTVALLTLAVESVAIFLGVPPGGTTAAIAFIASAGPIIKVIGPWLMLALEAVDVGKSLAELLSSQCLQMKVVLTDKVEEATHTMELACRAEEKKDQKQTDTNADTATRSDPKPTDTSAASSVYTTPSFSECESKLRVIRFVPLPLDEFNGPKTPLETLIVNATPYLFPNDGIIDTSIDELSKIMDLPAGFIDSEAESLAILTNELQNNTNGTLSDEAYEAYFTLVKMLQLFKSSSDPTPVHVNTTIQALNDVDTSIVNGLLIWQFQRDWNSQVEKTIGSTSKIVAVNHTRIRELFANVRKALVHEQRVHGEDSPKSVFLTQLYETLQTLMVNNNIELIAKEVLDAAEEAIERYKLGHVSGSFCLSDDEDILILLQPYVTTNPTVKTLVDQLQKLIARNKGWFTWCEHSDAKQSIDLSVYVQTKQLLSRTNATCKEIQDLIARIEPHRAWLMYDLFSQQLTERLESCNGGLKGGHGLSSSYGWVPLSRCDVALTFPFG